MHTVKRTMIAAALGAAAVGTISAGSASAATSSGVASHAAPAVIAKPATIYNVPCWTTFAPPNPNGAAMTQYYANCSNSAATVCPAVIDNNGNETIYVSAAAYVGPYDGIADDSDTAVWYYQATIPGDHYTTVFC
jgi:hypothetical protein